mmetsp:Transcript_15138/g.36639  ORF Transcript_15138/g.36639 Transcript_15138/m.36639 type:complete len:207 (+) Transcript_15138:211-831(+)
MYACVEGLRALRTCLRKLTSKTLSHTGKKRDSFSRNSLHFSLFFSRSLRGVLSVDLHVVVGEVAAPGGACARPRAHLDADHHGAVHPRGVLHVPAHGGGVEAQRLPVLHEHMRAHLDAQVVLLEGHPGVPCGARQAPPVGVVPENGGLDEGGGHDGARDDPRVLVAPRPQHVHLDEAGGALAVPRDGLGDGHAHRPQRRLQRRCLR